MKKATARTPAKRPKKIVVEFTPMSYRSQGDEAAFFEWLDKLKCVGGYRGAGRTLRLEIVEGLLDDEGLRELLALFKRYGGNMKPLAVFRDDRRRSWFADPERSWFREVFGEE